MTLNPSDVVKIPFPFSDLKSSKRRPVLVIHKPDKYGDFIATAITTRQHHSGAYLLNPSDFQAGSLPKLSFVRLNKIYTLNTESVLFICGRLQSDVFGKIQSNLCQGLGCY